MASKASQAGEIRLGGQTYSLGAPYAALRRLSEHLAPLRPATKAYSYWDAIGELWRTERGMIMVNAHVLTVFVWAFLHIDRRGEMAWAGLSLDEVGALVDAAIADADSIQAGEIAVFFLVLDTLYRDKVIRAPQEAADGPNPTEAVADAAAKMQ